MSQRVTNIVLTATIAIGLGVAGVATMAQASQRDKPVRVAIRDVQGTQIGTLAVVRKDGTRSRVTVKVHHLAPGYHGFHIHAVGVCDPKSVDPATGQVSPFFSAGGHLDLAPGGQSHPSHSGDMPPLLVRQDGTGSASFITDRFRAAQLSDADGSAVIVHALPDNFANIPDRYAPKGPDEATLKTGDSGPRVACGAIKPIKAPK
ncbi:superoxide dismutase family protein [Acrocarpospora sp. B8E8]|uniref:superoxide dismutase family protein n=1 Tax=Acrocarpospora sp. B8E8 TaxID=3153572 RepID=UPI00325F418C